MKFRKSESDPRLPAACPLLACVAMEALVQLWFSSVETITGEE